MILQALLLAMVFGAQTRRDPAQPPPVPAELCAPSAPASLDPSLPVTPAALRFAHFARARALSERFGPPPPFAGLLGSGGATSWPTPGGRARARPIFCVIDSDSDGVVDCLDLCPLDPGKSTPGYCGCGIADTDSDEDGAPNCHDECPTDPLKVNAGYCGCFTPETDSDFDGTPNCIDGCPLDALKIAPGPCGCGQLDIDTDGDTVLDCNDGCPLDPNKTAPGVCGCSAPDITYYVDADGDSFGNSGSGSIACSPPPGSVTLGSDCDDGDPFIHPCARELNGNLTDDDCDQLVDEASDATNNIVCENSLTGSPATQWDITGAGDESIQGFATNISVDQGQTIEFKIKTVSTDYRIDIYRLGYYAGLGARRVATLQPSAALPQTQPACLTNSSEGLIDCGNWSVSASWTVPPDATSGIYIARPVREDPGNEGKASHIVFVVRDDNGSTDVLVQTSDPTWQAYNAYGGTSLYVDHTFGLTVQRGLKVSYNRPFFTRANIDDIGRRDFVFSAEYPMLRWLEANGYDLSYCAGVDTDRAGAELLEHEVFLSVGHDEYWSAGQRASVEAARDAGVNLAFFSGNEVFWKTRWENSFDESDTPYRTLVCYKETRSHAKIDPEPGIWTGTWRDPRFSDISDGGVPENSLTGTLFRINAPQHASIIVPAAEGKLRFWRNTSVALLGTGQHATLPIGTLGHEWDEISDNGSLPAGLMRLSATELTVPDTFLLDYGSNYGSGTTTHGMTMYRAPSGALVFSAGTVQWSWGLDSTHDDGPSNTDVRMRQATVNLLADMGVQPQTLQSGLTAASASTDTSAPISTIVSPLDDAMVLACVPIWISGSASDLGGGVIGGVEVSVDGGFTWHPATGREAWSYQWLPGATGAVEIRCRAVDDSGNLQASPTVIDVTRVTDSSCPVSLWGGAATPTEDSSTDPVPVEVGIRFRSDVDGSISGLRFYKGLGNNGTHYGRLWTAGGTLLGALEFTNETAHGWQQTNFASPIAITAGQIYVASYSCQAGGYALDHNYFTANEVSNGVLHAPEAGVEGPNGVYVYGTPGFPSSTYLDSNYWIDVIFTP